MPRDMIVVSEGFSLDDSGNLIWTMYVDLREEAERTAIPGLIKGCKKEHALEDGETLLISSPARFREDGDKLIKDINEGFAQEESVTEANETAAQARKRRTVEELNEAREILKSKLSLKERVSFRKTKSDRKSFSYGKDWWIFCTSIEPMGDDYDTWRDTLPDEYNHVSRVGQPAKFAQALAHMVIEKVGPLGKGGSLNHTVNGQVIGESKHPYQHVVHGPVLYTDDVYDFLSDADDEFAKVMAFIFTKGKRYAAQREYRFAVFNGGVEQETSLLPISGMMRDSLKPIQGGLIRAAPPRLTKVGGKVSDEFPKSKATSKLISKQSTKTHKLTTVEDRRWQTRSPDGQIISSESDRQERTLEKIVTSDSSSDDGVSLAKEWTENTDGALDPSGQMFEQQSGKADGSLSEEATVEEIAEKEREWGGGPLQENDLTIPVRSGTGRVYRSFQEAINDPAFPTGISGKSWQEEASSPEELAKTCGAIGILSYKISELPVECRQEAASAGWHAVNCIRNICARFGDIVDSVWIERDRFVVIRLKDPRKLRATGRIVVSPGGAYAYCLRKSSSETLGSGGEDWGTMFFPMGTEIESFTTYGWPSREGST